MWSKRRSFFRVFLSGQHEQIIKPKRISQKVYYPWLHSGPIPRQSDKCYTFTVLISQNSSYRYVKQVEGKVARYHVVTWSARSPNLSFGIFDISVDFRTSLYQSFKPFSSSWASVTRPPSKPTRPTPATAACSSARRTTTASGSPSTPSAATAASSWAAPTSLSARPASPARQIANFHRYCIHTHTHTIFCNEFALTWVKGRKWCWW